MRIVRYLTLLLCLFSFCPSFVSAQTLNQTVSDPLNTAQDPLNSNWFHCASHDELYVPTGGSFVLTHMTAGDNGCALWNHGFSNTNMYQTFYATTVPLKPCVGGNQAILYLRNHEFTPAPASAYRLRLITVANSRGSCGSFSYTVDQIGETGLVTHTYMTGGTIAKGSVTFAIFGTTFSNTTLYVYSGTTQIASFSTMPAGSGNYLVGDLLGFEINDTGNGSTPEIEMTSFEAGFVTVP